MESDSLSYALGRTTTGFKFFFASARSSQGGLVRAKIFMLDAWRGDDAMATRTDWADLVPENTSHGHRPCIHTSHVRKIVVCNYYSTVHSP